MHRAVVLWGCWAAVLAAVVVTALRVVLEQRGRRRQHVQRADEWRLRRRQAVETPDRPKNGCSADGHTAHETFSSSTRPVHVVVVLGSGGHTTEMLALLRRDHGLWGLPADAPPVDVSFVYAATDRRTPTWRQRFAEALPPSWRVLGWHAIPRAREVGQNWLSTVVTSAAALLASWRLLWRWWWWWTPWPGRQRPPACSFPAVIICNGPGTCIPLCAAAWMMRVLRRIGSGGGALRPAADRPRLVFVETVARVQHLSVSGRCLYGCADRVIVQWAPLARRYPLCEFYGRLV